MRRQYFPIIIIHNNRGPIARDCVGEVWVTGKQCVMRALLQGLSIPASRHFSRYPLMACAVMAIIGVFVLSLPANSKDLIFNIPKLIETISAGITLYPGDIIATGTPAGVGLGFKPPKYLKGGDVVRLEVDGVGVLENTMVLGE